MLLPAAGDDTVRLADEKTLDDVLVMQSDDRRKILHQYLVKENPILMQEPIAWSDQESIGRFLLLKRFLDNDESRRYLLLEARRVFYEENSFVIPLNGVSRFLDDMLGDWKDAVAVETLVRNLAIKVERDGCECGQLMEYVQRLSYFVKMPQLRTISFEWHTPKTDAVDAVSYGWSTVSGDSSTKCDSLQSSTGDETTDEEDTDQVFEWETSEDDTWSLGEGMEG